ncbi:MAG: DUF72 domain-containing protein [Acidobacteriota bacterium]|nr:DUF72 domain-containing protein [Acidobacteriota bacterium]MDQ5872264.1 DUF72 domain-containing protein [Acidobacteriota bacterium]
MRVLPGTSGFSYKEWKGSFYPDDLPASSMLSHYASRLPAVEINNTFYRMPRASLLESWAEQVPDGFTFALKASQQITHRKRLKEAEEAVSYFFQVATTLGDRLGPVLFQLPPNLKKDLPRLSDFLALLPPASRSAFEFRHESWFDDEVFGALRSAGAALCWAEDEDLSTPRVATAGWGYLRLRRPDYTDEDVASWADRIRGEAWSDAYVFFKHEDEGTGPRLAERMREQFP